MSIPNLPVNFKDDILAATNLKRKYNLIQNGDETVSFEDATEYQQTGSYFGAGQINATNDAINKIYSERILSLEEAALVTETGFFVDAMAVSELIGDLQWSEWANAGSNAGLTTKYRKNKSMVEVYVQGTLDNVGFTNQSGYTIGTLPVGARPPYARRYQLTDSRLYMDITASGTVSIMANTNIGSTKSKISFSECFGI